MSDEGEKTCPLCAEEMDLTDQQLKPCKCGYEICVWCWHHIMDMAEKEETEGRCPACRTSYDKEKIVGMAAKCERMVAEVTTERKKSQKAKTKTSEGRKQLSSVRVIQRNLVYIVGLPLNLADEDLLQRKEYFGQYGKVLKVSISRTSAGTIQQFANSTCSVYITYSKEDEAVRCIQSVHLFNLEGRSLRACFGTTKYCHAWLRNVPCTNPDCLYLHEIGSQEDSFTKDEVISSYTRNRVQQITGATNNMQRRSGSVLPPPMDDYSSNSCSITGKPPIRSNSNSSATNPRSSPPNSSSGRSGVLPPAASWGTRASNCKTTAGNLNCSNGPLKHKPDTSISSMAFSTTVVCSSQTSTLVSDVGKRLILDEDGHSRHNTNKSESSENLQQHDGENTVKNGSAISITPVETPASMDPATWHPSPSEAEDNNREIRFSPNVSHYAERHSNISNLEMESAYSDGKVQNLCSDKRLDGEHAEDTHSNDLRLDSYMFPDIQGIQQNDSETLRVNMTSPVGSKVSTTFDGVSASRESCDQRLDALTASIQNASSGMLDQFNLVGQRDAIVDDQMPLHNSSQPPHLLNHFRSQRLHDDDAVSYNMNSAIVNMQGGDGIRLNSATASILSNGYFENFGTSTSNYSSIGGKGNGMGRFDDEEAGVDTNPALDMESSIISNILSLDLDSWDDPLTSPQNLVKLLGEPDKQPGSMKISSGWKTQNSNQSRFSFARQDEPRSQLVEVEPSFSNTIHSSMNGSFGHPFLENREPYLHRLGNGFGFSQHNAELSDNFSSGTSFFSSNKTSIARAQISAPPGFSLPSRPPPPGFSSHERNDQPFDLKNGNHFLDMSPLVRNPYQASPSGITSAAGDIEFMDPAILAVGKGRLTGGLMNNTGFDIRPIFPSQSPGSENDAKLQLLMQRSLSPHQNLRYNDARDSFSPTSDAYGFTSRHMEQSHASNHSPLSQFSLPSRNTVMTNGHWDGWSEHQAGNDMGISEILRNDRMGFNKLYGSFEDSKFQMPSSPNLYNRTFGM